MGKSQEFHLMIMGIKFKILSVSQGRIATSVKQLRVEKYNFFKNSQKNHEFCRTVVVKKGHEFHQML